MKTAVILAAREEQDSETPYPLLPFEGNLCLLDRTIKILEDLKYDTIIIIVGYKCELFDKYQNEKIKIVTNNQYCFTSSMASLALAEPYLSDDFLLIEGDTFYEQKVIGELDKSPNRNCFAVTEESGSGDEAFVQLREGFISKISKDKHQICNFQGELLGIAKISYLTFQKMMNIWSKSNNPLLNYEYLFFDCTDILERPSLVFPNLIWGDVDDKEDFKKLKNYIYPRLRRKENPFDYDNIMAYLKTVFPDKLVDEQIVINPIGGMSNKNFKITFDSKEYVLRIPGLGSEGMVNRQNEEFNSLKTCKIGINPQIIYFNPSTGIKVAEFILDAETLNPATIQRVENIKQIAEKLYLLHNSNIRLNNDFNVFHEIVKYENLLFQSGGEMYEEYENIRNTVMSLADDLDDLGVSLKPCHNDLVAENFIKDTKGQIYLIDWEYSGMNDPLWDIAALFLESNFSLDTQKYFLDKYFIDTIPEFTTKKITIYQILMDILWSIWTRIKEAKGDNFGTYGYDRFLRACNNMRILKMNK